jgi:hypothetical protein
MLRCVQFLSFPFHIVSVQSKASNHPNQVASLIAVPAVYSFFPFPSILFPFSPRQAITPTK